MRTRGLPILAAILLPGLTHSFAGAGSVTEDFTTTTYQDVAKTTTDWNTTAGELRLAPFALSLVGSHDTPGSAFDVAVAGDLAFVADQLQGLQVIDITDVSAPSLLGSVDTAGSALGIAVSGNRIYLADSAGGLRIIDVTTPSSPTLLGTYDTTGFASGVVLSGDYAYVADYSGGLKVIDVSNAAIPTLAGSLSTPGNVTGVAVDGDLVFLSDESRGLHAVDVSNPSAPVSLGFFDTAGTALGVAVDGDHVFVADGGSGLLIFDVTNPAIPALIGTYNTAGTARGVVVTGNRAFVADDSNGLQVIDITDPANPTLVDGYATVGQARSVAVSGTHSFVAASAGGVHIIETSQVLGTPQFVGSLMDGGSGSGIAIKGDYAFLGSGFGTQGFKVVDISDPANPVVVVSYDTPLSGAEVEVEGEYAYLSDGSSILVMDISDPTNPVLAGSYNPASFADGLEVEGDLGLITMQTGGFELFDVSNPSSPTYLATFFTVNQATDIAVSGDHAFVTRWLYGLEIVNISDPANPVSVSTIQTPGDAIGVAIAGDLAFVSEGNSGLQVIDISNLASPVLMGSLDTPGFAGVPTVSGNYVFLPEREASNGLQVIDVSDPSNPVFLGSYATSNSSWSVAVAGRYAFLKGSIELSVIQVFQEDTDARNNVGQSLVLDSTPDDIVRARVSPTETPGINWELSADGGTSFETVATNSWIELSLPGNDLLWRSTLSWSPGTVPSVSSVTVDWLNEYAPITTVVDVPNDQGRQVAVEWVRSGHDFLGDAQQIVEYAVYRQIDPNLNKGSESPPPFFENLSPTARENAEMMRQAGWYFLLTVPVLVEDSYAVIVPTVADSTVANGQYLSTFRVTSLTATPGVFFHSPSVSGYSLDNLAPGVPQAITAAYGPQSVSLDWMDAPEVDFQLYRVYRSTDPTFVPSPGDLVQETAVSFWTDPSPDRWNYRYKVTTVDLSGNEGAPGSIAVVTGAPTPISEVGFALDAAMPNPFNPTTTIGYSLPAPGRVRLTIYSLAGRVVLTLVDEVRPAGRHSVRWDGRDASGRGVASGVYLYELRSQALVQRKRMVLLK